MLCRDIVAGRLILLQFLAMPDVAGKEDGEDDRQDDDDDGRYSPASDIDSDGLSSVHTSDGCSDVASDTGLDEEQQMPHWTHDDVLRAFRRGS